MTRKTVEQSISICDGCQKDQGSRSSNTCLSCGAEYCLDCGEKHGVSYQHAVHAQGSDDGFYCQKCDRDDNSTLHEAYKMVAREQTFQAEVHDYLRVRAQAVNTLMKIELARYKDEQAAKKAAAKKAAAKQP